MKDKLRIAVLGMTHDHLWDNLADLNVSPRGKLVAAADPHQELRDKVEAQFDCPRVFESYEELLQNVEVDAVYVYSDHVTSANLTVLAAERGKHIMVEKAMAATLADARVIFFLLGLRPHPLPGPPHRRHRPLLPNRPRTRLLA